MPEKPPPEPGPELDLSPYEGCWVALVRGQVCGVGKDGPRQRGGPRGVRLCEEPAVIYVRNAPPPRE